jgi:hypothetical protein
MTAENRHLLYEDDDGNLVGLEEVQLLDNPPQSRLPGLRRLLREEDSFLRFQAALVLAAWGDADGLRAIEEMIDSQIHLRVELSPHRLGGYDNVYDDLADATRKYSLCLGETPDVERIYAKLLSLYGPAQFESKFKHALLRSNLSEKLFDHTVEAISRANMLGRRYLASQLVPVVARWRPSEARALVSQFVNIPRETPDPLNNVAEALGYVDDVWSRDLLRRLSNDDDPAVAGEANNSLAKLASKIRR